jgi:hypothetical protein
MYENKPKASIQKVLVKELTEEFTSAEKIKK